jgi:hypothetical protein
MFVHFGGFVMRAVEGRDDLTLVTTYAAIDPQGSLPIWVVNLMKEQRAMVVAALSSAVLKNTHLWKRSVPRGPLASAPGSVSGPAPAVVDPKVEWRKQAELCIAMCKTAEAAAIAASEGKSGACLDGWEPAGSKEGVLILYKDPPAECVGPAASYQWVMVTRLCCFFAFNPC